MYTTNLVFAQLKLQVPKPHKKDTIFRYDPPVMIVASTWHETKVPYGRMLRDNLLREYSGNEASVSCHCYLPLPNSRDDQQQILLMEVALDTSTKSAAEDNSYGDGKSTVVTQSPKSAEVFLREHPSAKIIVIIDTHCLNNGFFVWKGTSAANYAACSLAEVHSAHHPIFLV